ncbi:MAG TPA: family 78 glycoside hydrolase catalytic domain [Mycobacteriales bacterium]|nr:family 78 glycoside hydrolase catalytic domain [Mycobacteriales bacterium]
MTITVERLRADDLDDPVGLGTPTPVLSWNVRSTGHSVRQAAFEVQVADDAAFTDLRWAPGLRAGEQPWTSYGGAPLQSQTRTYWRVRVRVRVGDAADALSPWSASAVLETGLLHPADWSVSWITHPDWVDGDDPSALPLLAKEFSLRANVRKARLYVTGVGVYRATVNGAPVTDAVLEPPYSNFAETIDYATYDVTDALAAGGNVVGVALGTGMAHVIDQPGRYTKLTGTIARPRALVQLEITTEDGATQLISSDRTWQATLGPTTRTHWFGGENHDARTADPLWDRAGGDRSGWVHAVELDWNPELTARSAPQIRVVEEIPAVAFRRPVDGARVFDLGLNIAGWPRLRVDTEAGREIRLIPGELLEPDGQVSQRHTGSPILDIYTTVDGPQEWQPNFVYHGFRYLQVHGLPDNTGTEAISGLVLRAANESSGHFACSDDLFNGIHRIIDRAVQGNMFSVLTDCPHREKLGWLEQTHLLFSVVSRGYDVRAYYRDHVRRMAEAQTDDGLVPGISPEFVVFDGGFRDDPNWGGAIVLTPWEMYLAYGDTETLRAYYPNMVRYLHYLQDKAEGAILDYGLGDWITLDDSTPRAVAATWGYHRIAVALSEIAAVLGEDADAATFRGLADTIGSAFHETFFDGRDSYGSGSQACDAFALDLGVVPGEARSAVVAHLVGSITAAGDHLTVGEVALPAVFRVLSAAGHDELIHRIASRTDWPSYGFQLVHGATALTEAWDGPTRGLSQNHFMLGAIDDWFHRSTGRPGSATRLGRLPPPADRADSDR